MLSHSIYGSWRSAQEQKIKEMRRHLGPAFDEIFSGRILDIGCGHGYLEKTFKGNFIGIDSSIEMLSKPAAIFPRVLGNGDALPFHDGSFDAIVSIDVIHLLKTDDFSRVLKQSGYALFSIFFNKENYHEKREMIMNKLSSLEIIKEFEVHGKENEIFVVGVKRA